MEISGSASLYKLAMALCKGVTANRLRRIREKGIDAEEFFRQDSQHLLLKIGLGDRLMPVLANRQKALEKAAQELKFIERNNIRTLFLGEDNYPSRLASCPDAPTVLFVLGEANLNMSPSCIRCRASV